MTNRGKLAALLATVLPLAAASPSPVHLSLTLDHRDVYADAPVLATLSYATRREAGQPKIKAEFGAADYRTVALDESNDANATHFFGTRRVILYPAISGTLTVAPRVSVGLPPGNDAQSYERFKDISAFDNMIYATFRPEASVTVKRHTDSSDIPLIGTVKIDAAVNKQTVRPREPLHLTVTIRGTGNLDLLTERNLTIRGVTVYASAPHTKLRYDDHQRSGEVTLNYTMIAERSFTIPPLSWDRIDPVTGQTSRLTTRPIPVTVGSTDTEETPAETDGPAWRQWLRDAFMFAAGAAVALLGSKISLPWRKRLPASRTPAQRIAAAKNDRELLVLLLPYADDPQIAEAIRTLEETIYRGAGKGTIDKKRLARTVALLENRPDRGWRTDDPFA